MSKLPEEMILDLLCRLPVKSLLRLRSTSKHLCSLIDSPDFTKLHLQHSLQTLANQSLILTLTHLHSIDLRSADRAVEIDHPLKTPRGETTVLGSCNGLLCLFNTEVEIVFWNMSTRQHHRVPYAPITSPNGAAASRHMFSTAGFGFGYDPVHDDYKLVKIVRFRGTLESQAMVYGLKSNSWKRVDQGFPYDFLARVSVGLFADGALHWLANPLGGGEGVVVAFDLATEEFQMVPEPLQAPGETRARVQLGVWENRFCVIHIRPGKRVDMWAMKQYGVKESWTRVLSTSKPQITSASKCMIPLAHMSNGDELLLLKDFQKIFRYDLKKNKVKFARILGLPDLLDTFLYCSFPYVESLVNPLVNVDDEAVGKSKSKRGKKNVKQRDGYLSKGFKLVL